MRGIESDVFRRNLVGGIIQLARRLGLSVVAEGVETPAQLDVLRRESCKVVQGFLFGRPLAPEHFARHASSRPPAAVVARP